MDPAETLAAEVNGVAEDIDPMWRKRFRHLFATRGDVGVMSSIAADMADMADMAAMTDEELWRRSRAGDRDAFGRIVERYQSLVCALAYSACGNLAGAEDLAQETFLAAWRRLGDLREPAKLRAWLCGIARNLAASSVRREIRRGGAPEPLEAASETPSEDVDPAALAATEDEEGLLWRTLAALPENYREPLVLFYREQESVAEVARQLELSEETVRQRLSRGRSLLRDELAVLVESTLGRTRPTVAFTSAVMAAIPPVTAPEAAAWSGMGGGVVVAAKSLLAKLGLGAVLGPVVGLGIAWFSSRAVSLTARSPEERKCLRRHAAKATVFAFVMSLGLAGVLGYAATAYVASPGWLLAGILAWIVVLLAGIMRVHGRSEREVRRIRAETGTTDEMHARELAKVGLKLGGPRRWQSSWRFLGLPLVAFATGGMDPGSHLPRSARGWIAFGDLAISPLLAIGGTAIAPLALGGISIGFISFGGLAFGGLALGSMAMGWWAMGPGALGWEAAAGGLAVARDYALGGMVRAAEANNAVARDWFREQWFTTGAVFALRHAVWLVVASVVIPVGLVLRRAWRMRRLSRDR